MIFVLQIKCEQTYQLIIIEKKRKYCRQVSNSFFTVCPYWHEFQVQRLALKSQMEQWLCALEDTC